MIYCSFPSRIKQRKTKEISSNVCYKLDVEYKALFYGLFCSLSLPLCLFALWRPAVVLALVVLTLEVEAVEVVVIMEEEVVVPIVVEGLMVVLI